jgi:hypothetical protein
MEELVYSSTILNLGARWERVVSFTIRQLYPGQRDPGTHLIGGGVRPRARFEAVELRFPGRNKNPVCPSVRRVALRYTD